MRGVTTVFLIVLLLISGCSENNQITSPNTDSEIQKISGPSESSNLNEIQSARYLDIMPVWINMPVPASSLQPSTLYVSKLVYNDRSTNVIIDTFYLGGIFDTVKIKLKLMFMPGDLPQDSMLVTVELNIENGTIKFGPSAVFNNPLRLDYKIAGLDFSSMDPDKIRFIYACDNGSIESVACDNYEIKESDGSIQMWQGKIPHFSRYGFVKRSVGH